MKCIYPFEHFAPHVPRRHGDLVRVLPIEQRSRWLACGTGHERSYIEEWPPCGDPSRDGNRRGGTR
jgi:hypothetical protein